MGEASENARTTSPRDKSKCYSVWLYEMWNSFMGVSQTLAHGTSKNKKKTEKHKKKVRREQ